MLKNYIKIAFRVMLRQKFFTAVSIFGISFTIMIVSIIGVLTNSVVGNEAPFINHSKTIYFEGFVSIKNNSRISPPMGGEFLDDVKKLKGVSKVSKYITGYDVQSVVGNKKLRLITSFVDEEAWNIYKFEFIEGKPFGSKEVREGQSAGIITEAVRRHYFGDEKALGRYLPTSPKIRVYGVVKDFAGVIIGPGIEFSDLFLPLTRYHSVAKLPTYEGAIVTHRASDIPQVKEGILRLIKTKYNPNGGEIYLNAEDIYESMHLGLLLTLILTFLFFVMLVPALNLIGLNINRISERSSEIGIRKSFGATSTTLIVQFLTENLIITCLGGLLGTLLTLAFAGPVLQLMRVDGDIIPTGNAVVNWRVIIYAISASFVFGILSGVIPAWRMSRLHIVKAIKGVDL